MLLGLALASCADEAEPVRPELAAELVAALTAATDAHWGEVGAEGVTVAVRHGGATWLAARGLADAEARMTMAPASRLRVGSITKTFTAAAILQLADEGALGLDDPIDRWVPGFALGPAVTVRRALSHTTGLFNYTDDPSFLAEVAEPATPREIVAWALAHPPAFAPGASFGYSNTNFVLLGLVIEAADHRPWHTALRARLIDPAGLADTFVEGPEAAPELVPGYLNHVDLDLTYDPSWTWGTGALVSTAADLCAWVDVLYRSRRVLPPALVALMTTETVAADGTTTDYGFGTYLYLKGGRATLGHTGSTMGFNAEVFVEPVSGDCVAVLSNDFFGVTEALAEPLWSALAAAR